MSELKQCPFCGKDAVMEQVSKSEWFVVCTHGCVEQRKLYRSKKSAMDAWNRRANG